MQSSPSRGGGGGAVSQHQVEYCSTQLVHYCTWSTTVPPSSSSKWCIMIYEVPYKEKQSGRTLQYTLWPQQEGLSNSHETHLKLHAKRLDWILGTRRWSTQECRQEWQPSRKGTWRDRRRTVQWSDIVMHKPSKQEWRWIPVQRNERQQRERERERLISILLTTRSRSGTSKDMYSKYN